MDTFCIRELGLIPYRAAWALQEELRSARAAGAVPDTVLLCEHPPVFTIGRQDCRADWRATFATIERAGIEVVQVNRGGRITYHGPGQLVGYFIVDLRARRWGIRQFVARVERLLIDTLTLWGVTGSTDPAHPGVWIGEKKIAALGFHVRRGMTQHGFALNVAPDLSHYRYIVPCGIVDRGVTSLAEVMGAAVPTMRDVVPRIASCAGSMFTGDQRPATGDGRSHTASNVGASSPVGSS